MVDKSRQFCNSMESAPEAISVQKFPITIDVDGKITTDQGTFEPFPCQITNAVVWDSLIATWVDHDHAWLEWQKISLDDEMKMEFQGPTAVKSKHHNG